MRYKHAADWPWQRIICRTVFQYSKQCDVEPKSESVNHQEQQGRRFWEDLHQPQSVDWRARIPFWKQVINKTGARSVTEMV